MRTDDRCVGVGRVDEGAVLDNEVDTLARYSRRRDTVSKSRKGLKVGVFDQVFASLGGRVRIGAGCPRKTDQLVRILEEAGYDQVPTCSAVEGDYFSAERTMDMGKEVIAPERLVGYMTAPWRNTRTRDVYALLHDAYQFGIAKKLEYPKE